MYSEGDKYEVGFPVQFHTVDIAVVFKNSFFGPIILLGKKPNKDKFILPGGFVNIGETTEEAATRELEEETNLYYTIDYKDYIGSFVMQDERYLNSPHGITTSLFYINAHYWEKIKIKPGDDLDAIEWVNLKTLNIEKHISPNHKQLLYAVRQHFLVNEVKNGR